MVYKKPRDRGNKKAPYYYGYYDETGKRRTKKGCTDKAATERMESNAKDLTFKRRSGLIDPQLEEFAKQRRSPIEDHLTDFEESLRRNKKTEKHVQLTMSRLRKVVVGCGFNVLGDISADAVERFLETHCKSPKEILAEAAKAGSDGQSPKKSRGHKTFNHYCQAFEQFCNWLTNRRRVASNPVPKLPRRNSEEDVRKKRRPLTPEESEKLVESARQSSERIEGCDGETRARVYILSYMTGLRRSELASLTPSSFNFDGEQPTLTVTATISKHRRTDELPLHPLLIPMLRDWTKGLEPDQQLFPGLQKRRTWLMVKHDLEHVGIPYRSAGGCADFHAVGRHTYITQLVRSGVTLAEAMKLARHSDIKTTMKYIHIGLGDQANALSSLPVPCAWQQNGSTTGVNEGQSDANDGIECHSESAEQVVVNPCESAPCDAKKQKSAPVDTDAELWRRRGSNPRPETFSR